MVSKAALLLLGCLQVHAQIRCGTPLTTDCLGDSDIRYDPDVSNNIVDQQGSIIWEKLSGLFMAAGSFRVNEADPITGKVPIVPDPTFPVLTIPFYGFLNATNDGSRRTITYYTVVPDNPADPQQVTRELDFRTTSYDKDGTLVSLVATPSGFDEVAGVPLLPSGLRDYPVDENTAYYSNKIFLPLTGILNEIRVCLDDECNRYDQTSSIYTVINGTVLRIYSAEASFKRVASVEDWYAAIYARYNESNIPLDQRLDPTVYPCDEEGVCPTEEQWCQIDPNCSESPYQEPPASVRGGVIAGFTIAGVVILVAVLYLIHRHLLARQAQRYRTVFAKRIADTIEVRGSMRALPADALVEEFNRIDAGVKDGKLSKEEMWEFISSGKAGEMDKKDFDALFAAIDVDGSGNIDFLEFCAFMGKCHDEYRAARVDRGSIVAGRVSAASTAFVATPEDVTTTAEKDIVPA